jgi:hypothetical protein
MGCSLHKMPAHNKAEVIVHPLCDMICPSQVGFQLVTSQWIFTYIYYATNEFDLWERYPLKNCELSYATSCGASRSIVDGVLRFSLEIGCG